MTTAQQPEQETKIPTEATVTKILTDGVRMWLVTCWKCLGTGDNNQCLACGGDGRKLAADLYTKVNFKTMYRNRALDWNTHLMQIGLS